MTDIDDLALILSWRDGNKRAGEQLVRCYYPDLRRFFTSKIDDEVVREDLVQETFAALIGAVGEFRGDASARTFIFSIARRKLYDQLRHKYRHEHLDPLSSSIGAVLGRSPSSHAVLQVESQRLLEAITQLALDDQVMLELNYWQGMGAPELAVIFDLKPETVRGRLFRARHRLAKILTEGASEGPAQPQLDPGEVEARFRELGVQLM